MKGADAPQLRIQSCFPVVKRRRQPPPTVDATKINAFLCHCTVPAERNRAVLVEDASAGARHIPTEALMSQILFRIQRRTWRISSSVHKDVSAMAHRAFGSVRRRSPAFLKSLT